MYVCLKRLWPLDLVLERRRSGAFYTSTCRGHGRHESSSASAACRSWAWYVRLDMHSNYQDDVLRARLSSDEKFVRRIAKRITSLVQAQTNDEQCVLSMTY